MVPRFGSESPAPDRGLSRPVISCAISTIMRGRLRTRRSQVRLLQGAHARQSVPAPPRPPVVPPSSSPFAQALGFVTSRSPRPSIQSRANGLREGIACRLNQEVAGSTPAWRAISTSSKWSRPAVSSSRRPSPSARRVRVRLFGPARTRDSVPAPPRDSCSLSLRFARHSGSSPHAHRCSPRAGATPRWGARETASRPYLACPACLARPRHPSGRVSRRTRDEIRLWCRTCCAALVEYARGRSTAHGYDCRRRTRRVRRAR